MDPVDHVYSVYIKASPERVWRAITDGDDTARLLLRHARGLDLGVGRRDHLRLP